MARVPVAILDPTASTKTLVEVPDNVPSEQLAGALADRMGLPLVNRGGHPVSYRLSSSRGGVDQELGAGQTLAEAGIRANDALRLYADMEGGADPGREHPTSAHRSH
jgi:hypothetical protein